MTTTLTRSAAAAVLDRLFAAAERDDDRPVPDLSRADARQRADALRDIYMPVSRSGGELLYALARTCRPRTVVEFGTSHGISTIFLAAAVSDNGEGHVLTTELSADKVAAAGDNLARAGLAGVVTILPGDALETLADVPGPVDLVLLDGWKELCLPVLRLLEPRLRPGALVVADDTTFASMGDYLAYVRDPANGYVTVDFPVADGMELSCFTPAA
ncbi:O-methyltransferase [Pseudosporangium ferrugineum]|uniref:Putative O-methyltransferase YrrM n=1 Tax=Pseudosporangium ferrugineum TaxID=439699 RepID=A0A2T0SJD3_9ACTN|nr:class I SAM-dependent methyltransferase [Pseudosporangium ferrugineum]PRY33527.1 putative O-methyltransferase YrrM [Pseudosporangium ferrugineum]